MIPIEQLCKRAQKIYDDVDHATLTVDEKVIDGVIKRKTIEENVVKVFVSLSQLQGFIQKVTIYDVDGDILQEEWLDIDKQDHYKFLCVVEITVDNL